VPILCDVVTGRWPSIERQRPVPGLAHGLDDRPDHRLHAKRLLPAVAGIDLSDFRDLFDQRRSIDGRELPVLDDDLAIDDDRVHAAAALAIDDLPGGIVERKVSRVGEIEQRQVGRLADLQASDLAIEPPRKLDLTVNLKTASALGLEIPPSILARAEEYAHNRNVGGVHYPSDVQAGQVAGTVIAAMLFACPAFQSEERAAGRELRAALGLPAAPASRKP